MRLGREGALDEIEIPRSKSHAEIRWAIPAGKPVWRIREPDWVPRQITIAEATGRSGTVTEFCVGVRVSRRERR